MNKQDAKNAGSSAAKTTAGVVIMSGVAKTKKADKRKGELIEQNQDGLEVSPAMHIENFCSTSAALFVSLHFIDF